MVIGSREIVIGYWFIVIRRRRWGGRWRGRDENLNRRSQSLPALTHGSARGSEGGKRKREFEQKAAKGAKGGNQGRG